MTTPPETSPDFFVAGGALRASAQSYVRRPADDDLFNHILLGEFCYVLTPRQMGKTSLMVRTARRLESQGILTAVVDLTSIGISVTAEQWYLSILTQIGRGLHLARNVSTWWQEHQELSYMQRFTDFFRHWVMESRTERVVIFIDEIDSTLSLDFRDDFFAGIRSLYNARFVEPALDRLTFVLLGVASPADLIKDGMRTPFNIGHEIILNEFSRDNATVLSNMLETIFHGQGDRIFQRIFYWTNGHPYLTQKLCLTVVEEPNCFWNDEQIDHKVFSLFLAEESRKESNLKFIQERLLNHPLRDDLLRVYYQVVIGNRVRDEGQSILHNELKLSGIIEAKNGFLKIRNRIYQKVFDQTWVRNKLPTPWTTIITGVSIFITMLILAMLMYNTIILPNQKQDAISNFYREPRPEKRVKHLARLFSLQGVILPVGYKTEAIDMFYKLSYPEMMAIFPIGDLITPENCEDRVTVVNGLYTTLADFRQDRLNSPLLKQMADSLDSCRIQTTQQKATQIETEILHWLAARKANSQAEYNTAIDQYSKAILLNPANQSTNYELAQVYLAVGAYKEALNSLESILSNVPAPVAVTITPFPSVTKTDDLPSISSQVPSTQSVLPTISSLLQTPNLSTMESKSPTPSPTFGTPSLSGFISDADLIDAVRRLVRDDQGCQKYIKQNPLSGYPNLRKFGILSDLTSQQTAIAQVELTNTFATSKVVGTRTLTSFPTVAQVFTPTAPILPDRPRFEVTIYEVQKDDTLFTIAERFNLKPETLLFGNFNALRDNPHSLRPGQKLNILPVDGTYHQWSDGEGLNGVARFYSVKPEDIINYPGNRLDLNTIGDLNKPNIKAGTWLVVPGGKRAFTNWSVPIVTRKNPDAAKVIGAGYCGQVKEGPVGNGTFIWPSTQKFLSGIDYLPQANHPAIDIAAGMGTAICAVDSGVVVYSGWNDWGYGNLLIIDHGNGWQSIYGHLSQVNVNCGEGVKQGQVVAMAGSTGNSTGPHLHFELQHEQYGKVNPTLFLVK